MTSAPSRPAAAPASYAVLGRDADGQPLPRAAQRLTPLLPGSARVRGWVGPLLVAALAGVLRFWDLGRPARLLFDETYYAKDAYSMLLHGYVLDTVESADRQVLRGELDRLFTDTASFYVHPDLGKWLIAAGIRVFGMDPFGWRVAAAVAGTLTVLVLARLVRRLTGSTLLGCVAGLLLCFDGLHFVLSRLALLDVFLALFLVCAVACLVADRDWARARMVPALGDRSRGMWDVGPVLLLRPWRLAAGVCFGAAVATKWSGLWALAAFGLLAWAWDAGARRSLGVRWPVWKLAVVDGVPAFFSLVGVALVVYVATWAGWFAHVGEFEQRLGSDWGAYVERDASGLAEAGQSLVSLWHFHEEMWGFHVGQGLREATHPYMSDPHGWLIVNRPVGIAADTDIQPGDQGCPGPDTCIEQVLAIGTPLLWWGGVAALLVSVVLWLGARDWRFGVAVVGVVSTWLPWWRFTDRPIFFFYAVTIIPFTVIAVTLVLGKILGPPDASRSRRRLGAVVSGAFLVLVAANFAFFHPILTDALLSNEDWLDRMWFSRWI